MILLIFCWTSFPLENNYHGGYRSREAISTHDWKEEYIELMSEDASLLKDEEKWQKRSQSANADQTLIPYLETEFGKLDALVLTHTDQDHMGDGGGL